MTNHMLGLTALYTMPDLWDYGLVGSHTIRRDLTFAETLGQVLHERIEAEHERAEHERLANTPCPQCGRPLGWYFNKQHQRWQHSHFH